MNNKEFFAIKELSEYLLVRVKTLYAWAKSGKIPAYKVNGALRFKVQEIKDFIESGRVDPPDASRIAKKIIGKHLATGHNRVDSGQNTPRKERISYVQTR